MALGFMLADYWCENETVLYPPPALGGQFYLNAVAGAAKKGWREELRILEQQKLVKRGRLPSDDCCQDPEWHCPRCGRHRQSLYLPCLCEAA
jgi:hypothetical protein